MEAARTAATEQARVAADTGIDPSVNTQPPPVPAPPSAPRREPSSADQADADATGAPDDGANPSAPPDPTLPPQQQQQWSRKDAPRLAQKVEELSRTNEQLQHRLGERERTDAGALVRFASLIRTPDDYRALELKARGGDWEAKQQLEVADAWREMAAPVFALAQQQAEQYVRQIEQAYKHDLHALSALDGIDDGTIKKVTDSRSPSETLRVLYDAGRKAEQGRIAALETEISDLRRQLAARGAQPLGENGSAGAPSSLKSLVRSDGTLDEATIQRALNGDFVGAGTDRPAR
jgi:hypothetical protein